MKFEENNCKEYINDFNNCFIYFLVFKEQVVYVSRTHKNIYGMYQNILDKLFDSVYILECAEQSLNYYQDIYIKKYRPIYNKSMNMGMNMSLTKARNLIKDDFENFDLRKLKKMIKNMNIEVTTFNNKQTISNIDFVKIYQAVENQSKEDK